MPKSLFVTLKVISILLSMTLAIFALVFLFLLGMSLSNTVSFILFIGDMLFIVLLFILTTIVIDTHYKED